MTDLRGYALETVPELTPDRVLLHYEGLTFPPVDRRLAVRPGSRCWVGAAALGAGGTVGLVLVVPPAEAGGIAELLSLLVLPEHRRRGLGAALLARAEELARHSGAASLQGAYRTSWRSRPAVEALLAGQGWSPPQTRVLLARTSRASSKPVLTREAPPLPPEAEVVSWSDLGDEDLEAMHALCAEDGFPSRLSPFQDAERLEKGISLAVRWQGRVAGWLTVHRVAFDTVQYSTLFLAPVARGQRLYWRLLVEGARRRLADPDLKYAIFAIAPDNEIVRGILEGPLSRHVQQRSELRVSSKALAG